MFLSHGTYSKTESDQCHSVGNRLVCFSRNSTWNALCFIFHIKFHCLLHKRISRLALGAFRNVFEDVCVSFHPGCGAYEGPSRHESAQVRVWRRPSLPWFDFRSVSWTRLPAGSLPRFQWCCRTGAPGKWLRCLTCPGKMVLRMRVHWLFLGPFHFFFFNLKIIVVKYT